MKLAGAAASIDEHAHHDDAHADAHDDHAVVRCCSRAWWTPCLARPARVAVADQGPTDCPGCARGYRRATSTPPRSNGTILSIGSPTKRCLKNLAFRGRQSSIGQMRCHLSCWSPPGSRSACSLCRGVFESKPSAFKGLTKRVRLLGARATRSSTTSTTSTICTRRSSCTVLRTQSPKQPTGSTRT